MRVHITPDGRALRCQAEKGRCPYAEEGHPHITKDELVAFVAATGKSIRYCRGSREAVAEGREYDLTYHREGKRSVFATSSLSGRTRLVRGRPAPTEVLGRATKGPEPKAPTRSSKPAHRDARKSYTHPVLPQEAAQGALKRAFRNGLSKEEVAAWLERDRTEAIRIYAEALALQEDPRKLAAHAKRVGLLTTDPEVLARELRHEQARDRSALLQGLGVAPQASPDFEEVFARYLQARELEAPTLLLQESPEEIFKQVDGGGRRLPGHPAQEAFVAALEEAGIGEHAYFPRDSRRRFTERHRRDIIARFKRAQAFAPEREAASKLPPTESIKRFKGRRGVVPWEELSVGEQELVRSLPSTERFNPDTRRALPVGMTSRSGHTWKRVKWTDGTYFLVEASGSVGL